jgi:hypothetical protein
MIDGSAMTNEIETRKRIVGGRKMKAKRFTFGCAAILCLVMMLPAAASAGGSFHLSIGSRHSGIHLSSHSHHDWYGPRYVMVEREPCRPLRYRPLHRTVVWKTRLPIYKVVEVHPRPVIVKHRVVRPWRRIRRPIFRRVDVVHW